MRDPQNEKVTERSEIRGEFMGYMFNRRMCELEFYKNNYEFMYSDAANYAFLKYRFYNTFDTLLRENSKEILEQHANGEISDEVFMLKLEDGDGKIADMACRLLPPTCPDSIRMRMIEPDALVAACEDGAMKKRINDELIQQLGGVFFSYNADTGRITLRRSGIEENILSTIPLDAFEEKMSLKLRDVSQEDFSKFVSNIRSGARAFTVSVKCLDGDRELTLTGLAIYENAVYKMAVGRFGSSCVSPSFLDTFDQLTGAYTKGRITAYARHRINDLHLPTGVCIVDLDDFKQINDNFGHSKGDEVLRRIADILMKSAGDMGKLGRIGGDEFFIVYDNFDDINQVRYTLMGIRSLVTNAYSKAKDGFSVTVSIGCSLYPDDYNGSFEEMFKLADAFLYRAKDKGKDRYIVYNEEKHGPVEDIIRYGFKKSGFGKSELVCALANSQLCGERLDPEEILEKISRYFSIERVVLYDKTAGCVKAQYGQRCLTPEITSRTIGYIYDEGLTREYTNGYLTTNNSEYFALRAPKVYGMLMEQSTFALQHYLIHGKSGGEYVLSLDSVYSHTTWNLGDVQYYRIIARVLEAIL